MDIHKIASDIHKIMNIRSYGLFDLGMIDIFLQKHLPPENSVLSIPTICAYALDLV